MRNIAAVISYNGSAYCGFQVQKNGLGIQEVIEQALMKITGEKIRINAAGRTDAGVHAMGQVINFHTASLIPEEKLHMALNSVLPSDIRVIQAKDVDDEFHARFNAIKKTYAYLINTNRIADPLIAPICWHIPRKIDVTAARSAAEKIVGVHDFTGFCAAGSPIKDKVRNVMDLSIEEKDGLIRICVTADGFLYNMVRIIVGTLIEVGMGKLDLADIEKIFCENNRNIAGMTAPSRGLCLMWVEYRAFSLEKTIIKGINPFNCSM